jgi:hypothetical protein
VVESSALLKRRSPKGYRGFESLPHRFVQLSVRRGICRVSARINSYELGDDQCGGADAWRYRSHYFDHLSRRPNPQPKQGKPPRRDERFDNTLEAVSLFRFE